MVIMCFQLLYIQIFKELEKHLVYLNLRFVYICVQWLMYVCVYILLSIYAGVYAGAIGLERCAGPAVACV